MVKKNIRKEAFSAKNYVEVPVGVKIIAVFEYIGAVLSVILGILMMFGAGFLGSLIKAIPFIGSLGAGLFVFAGIIMILCGVLAYFIGRGLFAAQNWARIVIIVFSCIGFIGAIFSFNLVSLVINGVIGGYLLFAKEVKDAFE